MGFIGGQLGYHLLRWLNSTGEINHCDGSAYLNDSKLEKLLGRSVWREFQNKVVIDFGCGSGTDAIEIAKRGAKRVIGLDVRDSVLRSARLAAERANVTDRCEFVRDTEEKADVILSVDTFEHFSDPAAVLALMRKRLIHDGRVLIVFGPTWYHPLGGHLFSVFPWAHLIFTENALISWRSDFKHDGARHFHEVEGGLNQMTIRRFEKLVTASDFRIEQLELVPIRRLSLFANHWTREFTTAVVRCSLVNR